LRECLSKDDVPRDTSGQARLTLQQYVDLLGLPSGGAVRVSLGVASTFADVHHFLLFAATFLDNEPDARNLCLRTHC
jgi:hypothetical protein